MARKITQANVLAKLRALASSINRLTERELRLGKPISWGVLVPPAPNTTRGRTPNPFSGGN